MLVQLNNSSVTDNPGIKNGNPNPGVNIHAFILIDPILNVTAAYRSIGNKPIKVRMFILGPEILKKNRKIYNVAKRKNTS